MTEEARGAASRRPNGCPGKCDAHPGNRCRYDAGHPVETHRCDVEMSGFFMTWNAVTTLRGNAV